jgi:hypothetical protein
MAKTKMAAGRRKMRCGLFEWVEDLTEELMAERQAGLLKLLMA